MQHDVVVLLSFLVSFNSVPASQPLLGQGTVNAGTSLAIGADRILEDEYLAKIRGKRIGLITNHTGVNSQLETTADVLARRSDLKLVALFAPEHGIQGHAQAEQVLTSQRNVYSLYGDTRAPTPAMLENVDVLLYDMQDVGVRFYTYISTLFESMKAAARQGIPFVVLDRLNPIDATRVEGPVLEPGFESFVGIYNLPTRYGMTPGELASLLNSEAAIGADLTIIPVKGWKRSQWYDQTGMQWVLPSPNMATLGTATVYPGLCLIESTNLSEGRGTVRPFELIGAPWLKSRQLADRLNQLGLTGVRFRTQAFTPTFSKHQGKLCQGVQIHVSDRNRFQPIPTLLHILTEIRNLHPGKLKLEAKFFDRLSGNSWVRESLLRGQPVDQIVRRWQPGLEEFKKKREKYLLYP